MAGEAETPADGAGNVGVPVTGDADAAGESGISAGSQEAVDSSEVPASGGEAEGEGSVDAAPVDGAEAEPAGNAATDSVLAGSAANGLPSEAAPSEEATPLAEDDTEAPTMDGVMSVSTKRATAGDTVTFTLRASDEGTGLFWANLEFVNQDTGEESGAEADVIAEDGTLTFRFEVRDMHGPGRWAVRCVTLQDARGNFANYYDPRFASDWELESHPTADLSALDFEVYGTTGDTEAPVLIGAVGVTVRQVMPGRERHHDAAHRGPRRLPCLDNLPHAADGIGARRGARPQDGRRHHERHDGHHPPDRGGVWEALSVNVVDSNGVEKSVTNSALGARAAALSLSAEEASARSGDDILSRDSADLSALAFEVTPFESQVAGQFSDTPADAWYVTEGWLDYVVENGIISGYAHADGTPQGKFGPDDR